MAVLENHSQAVANGISLSMSTKYATYATFYTLEDAEALQEFFLLRNLVCVLDFSEGYYELNHNPTLDQGKVIKTYRILMERALFPQAEALQNQFFEENLDALPADYPLYNFTDMELFDVLEKFDTWSGLDYIMARKILAERGLPVSNDTIDNLKNKRIAFLKQPERLSKIQLVFGYIAAIAFGIFGTINGADILAEKELPDGSSMKKYDKNSQMHGKVMFTLGLISTALWVSILWYLSN